MRNMVIIEGLRIELLESQRGKKSWWISKLIWTVSGSVEEGRTQMQNFQKSKRFISNHKTRNRGRGRAGYQKYF